MRLPTGPPLGFTETALITVLLAAPVAALALLVAVWQLHPHARLAYVVWAGLTWLQLLTVLYLASGLLGVRSALPALLVFTGALAALILWLIGRYLWKILRDER